jgi:hypothetical protein
VATRAVNFPVVMSCGEADKRLVARLSGDTHLLLEAGRRSSIWCCAFAFMP